MKGQLLLLWIIALPGIVVVNSCQKNSSCENCPALNQPPIARAGADLIITLPTDSVTVNGSTSTDPDGSITTFLWTKISGPASCSIVNLNSALTPIKNLTQGVYSFELKVTDNDGLKAADTMVVTVTLSGINQSPVNPCVINRTVVNARLVPVGTLSEARIDVVTATAGNKILFAGGLFANNFISSRVDIYDFVTNTWTTAELSTLRHGFTVATIGNKIFFAGGYSDWNTASASTRVDVYDAGSNTWSKAELGEARSNIAASTVGDKIFFAGGYAWNNADYFSKHVDIYNSTTNTWSSASLSEGRDGLTATAAGGKIYFAGGNKGIDISNKIDIYDNNTGSWTTSTLSEKKMYLSSIAVANKIYWAGGYNSLGPQTASSQVEIKDINTQVSTVDCLSQAKAFFSTVLKGNEIMFFTGADNANPLIFDIYNITTKIWSIGTLNQRINYPGIISVNNKIYIAGGANDAGTISNQVSLLEW